MNLTDALRESMRPRRLSARWADMTHCNTGLLMLAVIIEGIDNMHRCAYDKSNAI